MNDFGQVPFDLDRVDTPGRSTIVAVGEIDFVSSPRLHEALSRVISEGRHIVEVDLSRVTFIDSSGLGTLVAADRHLRAVDGELRVVAASEQAARVIAITGLNDRFHLSTDTA